jgi:predicted nucleic acid-binding protein
MVLVELLNDFARRGESLRAAAVTLVERLSANPNVSIVAQTSLQFRDSLALYRERPDQTWSLTDCASFLIMTEQGIEEALAHDKHFEQMGFKALLRDKSDD